jgi:leader peptidase (prepilin peptidase) / N-methyltransferase
MMIVDQSVMYALAALFGLAAGSFINVLVLRTHQATSPWFGRSKCMSCGHVLSWHELLPLASFLWLRGKCRHCSAALSWQYPLVEAGTALVFVLVASRFGLTWFTLWGWMITSIMVAIAVYDARWSLLPDSFSIFLAITGLGMAVALRVPLIDIGIGLVGGTGFFGAQYVLSRGRWVGSGDILLGGALGLLLGWRMLGLALMLAYFIGAIVASVLLLTKRTKAQAAMAFGPYLVLGGFIAWLWGEQIVAWYFNHALFM